MTNQEILREIERLSLDERLELLEVLTHSIRETLQSKTRDSVVGMLKPDGDIPTDEAVKHDYVDYLDEKYS